MNTKLKRWKRIKSFLRMQTTPLSLTEIHEALTLRMHLDFSRKTIERDVGEMVDNMSLKELPGTPKRYASLAPMEVELILKNEEVKEILRLLETTSELYRKIKKYSDF